MTKGIRLVAYFVISGTFKKNYILIMVMMILALHCSKHQPTLNPVHFESGTTDIVQEDYQILEANCDSLKEYSDLKVELAGHTNSVGGDSENLVLSEARADTIKNWLVLNGIDDTRLTTKGCGESQPVANNQTAEGRAQDDRVEFIIR